MRRVLLFTTSISIGLACWIASGPISLGGDSAAKESPAFVPAGGFDWHRTISRRLIFTVDYWPGVPAITKEGRPDISSDIEHFKAYADPDIQLTIALSIRN